ncbi:MAG TPA: TOBE domain-containing protein [Propionibacteriaceae bacterium]|nr:TOBE domain-containing protein [Propionibacteriaceae bacterium]
MGRIRISDAAALVGVSDDTVRRWVEQGRLAALRDEAGTQVVDGAELATLLVDSGKELERLDAGLGRRSARNHLTGIVTKVLSDTVMSQVELQCGPYRVVSLVSTEAVRELGLEPGSVATAIIKATSVSVEAAR